MSTPRAEALVLFGITGDLARKSLLPALYRLVEQGRLTEPVVGVVRGDWTLDKVRQRAREAISARLPLDEKTFASLCELLRVAVVDYDDAGTFAGIAEQTDGLGHLAHYLAIPPSLFTTVAANLAAAGLNERARLVVEKPFGHDLASARELQDTLTRFFPEERLRRVDHFLGKDVIEDLLTFRTANTLMSAALTGPHVRGVQITMAEDFDVADRGSFYDAVGALQDVVQNHLLQTLAFLIMDRPAGDDPVAILDAKAEVLRTVRAVLPADYVRGQYAGYRDVAGVKPDSTTETYAALRLYVDDERWSGVPFTIRAGKSMAAKTLEIVIELQPAGGSPANLIRFRLDPNPGVTFDLLAKSAGGDGTDPVAATLDFACLSGDDVRAYTHILEDAVTGDPHRFSRMDIVEECWRIVGDILGPPGAPVVYRPGTWGPEEADRLTRDGRWSPLENAPR
ncbi:glucose-6-phosphate dehydrogenase [Nonomuraea soli]|uniref:Glucose-6-phosphate 1-dehydrogenase n=1 Tax=Nonomuraea soli TaxID=1032476 RepID=A0A7W0HNU0_9ACTN|nr:glucose-6-phosphate dehydrogenase [Nonomuraea soli]MBA2890169.1 glucose-6-phosphate 1-dehydrogenase [Nonomuraea soli]